MSDITQFNIKTNNVFKNLYLRRKHSFESGDKEVILKNRYRLFSEYKLISKRVNYKFRMYAQSIIHGIKGGYCADHGEFYNTQDNELIFVCSNYSKSIPPYGLLMRPIYPIYNTNATTWIVKWGGYEEARELLSVAKSITDTLQELSSISKGGGAK